MKSKSLFAPAALSFAALLAMQGLLPAEEPAAPAPNEVPEQNPNLLEVFYDAVDAGDLATMKAAYAKLQAADPKSDRLPRLSFEIAMADKDWPEVKKALENMPAGESGDNMVRDAIEAIVMGKWEGAPKDLFVVLTKKAEAGTQAAKENKAGDHLLLCILNWHAGNPDKSKEHARKAVQLSEEAKEPTAIRAATARFLKQVEGGTLPSMMEFMVWAQGVTPDDLNEAPVPDQGFDAAAHIGKPIDIKFTAADGTEVDLAKLKGKVVLIDFWATWCGPCVAEIPQVKDTYQKYHAKGFEIIGISFEGTDGKDKMMKLTKDKDMPWPQHYDGKSWNNAFGRRFSISSLPAMWLIDKQGNLTELNARENLAEKVAKLLGS